jgi:hypothetical protein
LTVGLVSCVAQSSPLAVDPRRHSASIPATVIPVGARTRVSAPAWAMAFARDLLGIPSEQSVALDLALAMPATARPIRRGDVLLFERGLRPEHAIWAVATHVRGSGVVEIAYVAGGVVRRGFVDPALRRVARDAAGTSHNTYLRHTRSLPPPGTRFLAGELLTRALRLPRSHRAVATEGSQ